MKCANALLALLTLVSQQQCSTKFDLGLGDCSVHVSPCRISSELIAGQVSDLDLIERPEIQLYIMR